MRVLVLGGNGHVGKRLIAMLQSTQWAVATGASRASPTLGESPVPWLSVDACDTQRLTQTLGNFDAVVNCVAGDRRAIATGATALTDAARVSGFPRLIHLSSMVVYGAAEGLVNETAPLRADLGWYAQAKHEAELAMASFARDGGEALVLRPGCIGGIGSRLWVSRIGKWLQAGRLGDLGEAGDGWSNLVDVDDVCQAVIAALRLPIAPGSLPAFNLAAPGSPRWNGYFVELAVEIGATPVRRVSKRQLRLDSVIAGPPLKILERLLQRAKRSTSGLPEAMPPGVVRLWDQHIQLDSTLATQVLRLSWKPCAQTLRESALWFADVHGQRRKVFQP